MRVLHLSTWKQRCGVADHTENIVGNLTGQGVECEVFPLDVAAFRYAPTADFVGELDRFVRTAANVDLIHVQHEYSLFAGSGGLVDSLRHFGHLLSGLRRISRPVVVTFHTEPSFASWLPAALPDPAVQANPIAGLIQWYRGKMHFRRNLASLTKLWQKCIVPHFGAGPGCFRAIVHTPRTRLQMIQAGFAPQSVSAIPLGHALRDPSFFRTSRKEAKAQLGLAPESVLLTIFGFVTAYKGYRLAADALQKLPANYHLAIVGGPNPANPLDTTLDSILRTWQGEDPRRLMITGFASRETMDLYYAATDICLAPFLPENRTGSATLTWALTSGRPTIATNIPVFSEIQQESECLLLSTPNAVYELAWNIQRLAGDAALQNRLAQNALQFAERHSWPRVAEMLRDVYCELTATAPQGRVSAATRPPPLSRVA
jgi:glycosyltransferase involved in cell wall biosynthesis